jgi:hypothetical protein
MNSLRAQSGWWQALSAAAIALAVDTLYLVIIWQEGEGELTSGRVLFVSACLAGAAAALVWGLTTSARTRAILFAMAAAMLVTWTLLTFSIGPLLAPAAAFAVYCAHVARSGARCGVWLAAFGAVLLVAAGLVLT